MNSLPKDLEKKLGPSSAEIDPRFKQQLKQSLFKEKPMAVSNPLIRFLKYIRSAPAIATLVALVIVGSASGLVATHQANNAQKAEVEVPANIDNLLSFEQMRAIVNKDNANGSITGIELEKEDSGMVYKVKFSDGSIRVYDAKTGQAVTGDNKAENDNNNVPANLSGTITATEARSIALKQRSGTVTKIELETEEGVLVYSVRFSDGGRVEVKAANGEVFRVRSASSTSTNSGSGNTSSSSSDSSSSSSDTTSDDHSGSSTSGSSQSGSSTSGSDDSSHSGSNSGSGSGSGGHGSDD